MDKRARHKQAIINRKKQEKELRLQGILDAAKRVFRKKGYQYTTMDDIALEAGITKPTIYRYFPSKEDLFYSFLTPTLEAINEEFGVLEGKLRKKQFSDGREYIHSVFQMFYRIYQISPDVFRILNSFAETGEYRYLNEEYSTVVGKTAEMSVKSIMKNLKGAAKQGLIVNFDNQMLAEIIYGSFLGLIQTMNMTAQIFKGVATVDPASDLVKNRIQQLEEIVSDILVPKTRPATKQSGKKNNKILS